MAETEEQSRIRFQVELEFVQCLANPNYIHCELNFFTINNRGYRDEGFKAWNTNPLCILITY